MKALLTKVFEGFQEDFGHPVKLIRLLQDHPDICVSLNAPAPCIDAYSIAPWHELGESKHLYGPSRERGSLMGWKQRDKHSYGSFILHRPEYAQIAQRAIVEDWGCDITDVQGFAGSKSELRNFTSTDQMVETNSPDMIESISPAKLAENLAHREIRIIHAPGIDYFQRYAWDGRLFLINSGGSHHFAAAKYIAARLPQAVALRGKLVTTRSPVAYARANAVWCFRLLAAAIRRLTSSGLRITGSLRGKCTGCILATSSGRSRVVLKKNFSPLIAELSEAGDVPLSTRYNW